MRKKKRKKDDQHVDESWLLPYSDLLTLLVALFIVLFASSEIDSVKYEKIAAFFKSEFSSGDSGIIQQPVPFPERDPVEEQTKEENEVIEDRGHLELVSLQELREKIDSYIESNDLTQSLETKLSSEGLMISILNDVSFDPGSADVSREGQEIAKEIANLLYTDPPHQIVISGHTDDVPMNNEIFGSNWELSVMRAVNFMTLILENENLDPARFSAKGYGEHRPVVPNTSAENRTKNRRVEVLILPNYDITEQLKEDEQ